jgi:quinolinate synthase
MKLNTLPKLLHCIENETPEIILTQELIDKAKQPILRMLKLSE